MSFVSLLLEAYLAGVFVSAILVGSACCHSGRLVNYELRPLLMRNNGNQVGKLHLD